MDGPVVVRMTRYRLDCTWEVSRFAPAGLSIEYHHGLPKPRIVANPPYPFKTLSAPFP